MAILPDEKNAVNGKGTTHDHNAVTIALAKKESAEHLHGIAEVYQSLRKKPLIIEAYPLDPPSTPTSPEGTETTTSESTAGSTKNATTTEDNVKVVHFLRHGQGFHNLMADMASAQGRQWEQFVPTESNPYIMSEIVDAPLTQKGRDQARAVQPLIQRMKEDHQPELIVLSSHCRALQTGLIAFEHLLGNGNERNSNLKRNVPGVPFVAHEMAREETGVHVCDKRRPKSQQVREFPMIDFDLIMSEEDLLFRTDRRESKAEIGERVYEFMEWLCKRDETCIGISSHSGWLLTAFNGVFQCEDSLKAWFQTGELRSVRLVFKQNDSHI